MKTIKRKLQNLLEDGKTIINSEMFPLVAGELDNHNIQYYAIDLSVNEVLMELKIPDKPLLGNLENVCKFIQRNDKNSDIMDFYKEVMNGEMPLTSIYECVTRILNEWKSDAETSLIFGDSVKVRNEAFKEIKQYDKLLESLREDF